MRKIITCLILNVILVSSLSSQTTAKERDRWKNINLVEEADTLQLTRLDLITLRREGANIIFWVKNIPVPVTSAYLKLKSIRERVGDVFEFSLFRFEGNCEKQLLGLQESVDSWKNGNPDVLTIDEKPSPVAPDSIGEVILAKACEVKPLKTAAK